MKPSRIFLSYRFSTAPHFFHFRVILQLVVHDIPHLQSRPLSLRRQQSNCYVLF